MKHCWLCFEGLEVVLNPSFLSLLHGWLAHQRLLEKDSNLARVHMTSKGSRSSTYRTQQESSSNCDWGIRISIKFRSRYTAQTIVPVAWYAKWPSPCRAQEQSYSPIFKVPLCNTLRLKANMTPWPSIYNREFVAAGKYTSNTLVTWVLNSSRFCPVFAMSKLRKCDSFWVKKCGIIGSR